jgi:hypothetical protein
MDVPTAIQDLNLLACEGVICNGAKVRASEEGVRCRA